MALGYNTNGFAHHSLADAVAIILESGYQSVAVTIERELLDPPDRSGVPDAIKKLQGILAARDTRVTIETGSRFILDPRRKHQPTLVSTGAADRTRRIEFLCAAIDIADAVNADSVSLWSGAPDDKSKREVVMDRLCASLQPVLRHAEHRNVRLSFEPEPGMFIERMADFEELFDHINHPLFGLTLDVGHVFCLNDGDLKAHVNRWRDRLWNVHIEDMRRDVHEHLMFGEGEMDFTETCEALGFYRFNDPVHVELSRHSHDAVNIAKRAYNFLVPYIWGA